MQVMANLAVAYADELDSYKVPFIEDPAIEETTLPESTAITISAQFVDKLNEASRFLRMKEPATASGSKYLETTFLRESLRTEPRHQISQ